MKFGVISLGDNRRDVLTGQRHTAVERHREILELGVKAEELGFDSFHVGEHHGCDYITSTPSVLLGALATQTERIRLSTSTALLPIQDPIRFAEDYATVDVISNGRAEVIVSRGIIERSYSDFGHDYANSRELFKENIQLVLRLWCEENVSWQGKFRTPIENYTVQPRPVQQPCVPMWIAGGFSPDSVLLAAELGLPLMLPSVVAPPIAFRGLVEAYRENFRESGFGGPVVGALAHLYCAKDGEAAMARSGPRHVDYMDWVLQELVAWGSIPTPGVDQPSAPSGLDFEVATTRGPVVAGNPQQVLDRLSGFLEAFEIDRYLFHVDAGALPQGDVFESMELLATEVLPKLDPEKRP